MASHHRVFTLVLAALFAVSLASCGSSSSSTTSAAPPASSTTSSSSSGSAPAPPSVKLSSVTISGLGAVLVDSQGHTLYTFAPDAHSKVSCTASCQSVWPPDVAPSSGTATASGAVKQAMIGSDPNPVGGRVVTYNGWPLYTYVTDSTPGQHAGQALTLNGGTWYVISPAGQPVKSSGSGGSGY